MLTPLFHRGQRLITRVLASGRGRERIEEPLARLAVKTCRAIVLQNVAFARHIYPKLVGQYGSFGLKRDYSGMHVVGLKKESGAIRGVIVANVRKTRRGCKRVLLPGEYNSDKWAYTQLFQIPESQIVTAGIGDDMDYKWNYESDPPQMGNFDYVISQAMLEHLLNPYKHVSDLAKMLNPGGRLILHTHVPGFPYHRHPIDCMRFFPDWFEEVGVRLGLRVLDRYIVELRICYTYLKDKPE